MTFEIAAFEEGRGPYWPDACTTSDQPCPTAYSGDDRVQMQRRWPGIPVVCRCHPHPAGVKAALLAPATPLATEADRRLAGELARIAPGSRHAAIDSDAFTARVIGRAQAEGITQFLDLGSGHIATSAAHAAVAGNPAATIVHVDHDPHVDDHNLAYFTENPILAVRPRTLVHGNAFAIGALLGSLYRTGALDLSRPVCVLLVDLLYYLEAAIDARSVIRRLVKHLPPGSLVAVNHLTDRALSTVDDPGGQAALRRDTDRWCLAMARCVPPHPQASSGNEFARRIADLDLLPPKITTTSSWPEPDTTRLARVPYTLAAVGRVPEPTPPHRPAPTSYRSPHHTSRDPRDDGNPVAGPRQDPPVPYWGDRCPRSHGCCKGLHTPANRADNQKYWSYLPTRCGQRPHPARVDDALRNGTLSSPADRQLARELMRISPAAAAAVKERDSFTTRVVEGALAEGITQFLDLGCGFISYSASYAALAGVRGAGGTTSLVLVDHDADVHDHNRGWLGRATHLERPFATAVRGNAFAVDAMLNDLRSTRLGDLDRPVCVLLVDLLHYLEHRRSPLTVIRRLMTRLPPGSWIALTYLTNQPLRPDIPPPARAALRDGTVRWCRAHARCVPPHPRACSPATFADWLADLELLPPGGITSQACWPQPDTTHDPQPPFTLAAVGRVPSASPRRPRSPRTVRRAAARDMLAGVIADSDVPFEEFAASADQSPAQLRRVLNGHGRISPDLAYAAARRYGIDPHALLTLQDHAELATIIARREHTAIASESPPVAGRHTLDVDDAASAIDVLHALIAATGLSRPAFAATLGYDRSSLTKTLSGRHYVTASLALGLAHRYGIDAADLLARQARHQIAVAAERAQPTEAPPS